MAKEMAKHYPKRDRFFAHKFTRRLRKSCAAMDIGRDACLLLTYVAHTEDAARYSGPVRFWNDQLSNVLGFNSPKQLVNARTKAVEGGWLVYSRHHNRGVGRYWVTIPKQFDDLDDSLIEEVDDELLSNHSAGGTNQEVNHSTNRSDNGMKKGRKAERKRDELRNEKGTKSGTPSNPIPNPDPIPKELDSLEFREAWAQWHQHRIEIKKKLTPTQTVALLKKFRTWGPERTIRAIEHTISNGWQGIREPDGNVNRGRAQTNDRPTTNQSIANLAAAAGMCQSPGSLVFDETAGNVQQGGSGLLGYDPRHVPD